MRKKLIEVALPLEAINRESAREKSIRQGHPSTLHLWWARRPLATARAIIFSQLVDDPSGHPDLFKTEKAQEQERQRLFRIIEELVLWENTTNEPVLQAARDEIWQSWRYTCAENADHPRAKELFDRHILPMFHDPFAGGGALPLEAQRLGLESCASDLNPVAVLINKAMIEIPPRFSNRRPVAPSSRNQKTLTSHQWRGVQGLTEDVRVYGHWMREEATRRIGHLYPTVTISPSMLKDRPDLKMYVGKELSVIAWLWVRTVKSPNPAFVHVDVPLASTFMLSTKAGKEAYVEPVVAPDGFRFEVRSGKPKDGSRAKNGTKLSRGANFQCLMSDTPMASEYIKDEGAAGRMGARLMAIVAEGDRGRVYLSPTPEHEAVARCGRPESAPTQELPLDDTGNFWCTRYGLTRFADLFSSRQLVALTTFSDLVQEVREQVIRDAVAAGFPNDGRTLASGGAGATAYGDAVGVYLGLVVSKAADYNSTICGWIGGGETLRSTFGRQAIPMVWDYCEANILGDATGSLQSVVNQLSRALDCVPARAGGTAVQCDAQSVVVAGRVVSTDPPYYDNIGYADLSDYFYVWLRRSLKAFVPNLFDTLAVPKAEELVATPYRHGGREKAEEFFLDGMTRAMHRLAEQTHPAFPVTIYYAFKQAETQSDEGTASTGWETFLDAVIRAGFAVSGTWPVRTEREGRSIGIGTNALASSIVLVCRPRATDAPTATRREFVSALNAELPIALAHLQRGNIAPVDLAQAAIGPGMGVYTRYARVLDAEGKPLPVREALILINQTLGEALAEQEGDFDADSRWALAWFEQSGFAEGEYGIAETLSTAKNTSVSGLVEAGILTSGRGKVRLLKPQELPPEWDPATDTRLTAWEMVHHLIRELEAGGESAAARLADKLGGKAEIARELCYRLYALCERKKRAPEALAYNSLVQSWPEITRLAREGGKPRVRQASMFTETED